MSKRQITIKLKESCPEGVDPALFSAMQEHFGPYSRLGEVMESEQLMDQFYQCYLGKYLLPNISDDVKIPDLPEATTELALITTDVINCFIENRDEAELFRRGLNQWATSNAATFVRLAGRAAYQGNLDAFFEAERQKAFSKIIASKSANA